MPRASLVEAKRGAGPLLPSYISYIYSPPCLRLFSLLCLLPTVPPYGGEGGLVLRGRVGKVVMGSLGMGSLINYRA